MRESLPVTQTCHPSLLTRQIPLCLFDARRSSWCAFLRRSRPRLGRAHTKLSYCNGEIQAASSNITLYVVGPYELPPCIAQALQSSDRNSVETEKEVGERREHIQA